MRRHYASLSLSPYNASAMRKLRAILKTTRAVLLSDARATLRDVRRVWTIVSPLAAVSWRFLTSRAFMTGF